MKKLTLSLVAASLTAASLGAFAAVPTGAAPFQVVVPDLKSGVDFTVEGLYLQPTASNLQYSVSSNSHDSTNTKISLLTPDYDFGFKVGVGYIFPNSGNDMQLSWTHFDNTSKDTVDKQAGFFEGLATVHSEANFKYDAMDLDMGQYLTMGTHFQARLFAGLRAAEVQENVTNTFSSIDAPLVDSVVEKSKFTGIGPRVGIDTNYHVGNCFGVVAHLATSLLVGRVESSAIRTHMVAGNVDSTKNITPDNQTRVVPAFDAKLGVDYTVPFKNNSSRMTVEAGYQATQYLDAIDRVQETGVTTSSVGFNGPYLSVNFKI